MQKLKILFALCFVLRGISPTFATDSLSIESFLSIRKIKAEKMVDGIFYTVHTEGGGKQVQEGDFIKIRYTGQLLSGKTFDASSPNEPYIFKLGDGQVIRGWNKALKKLKIGTKATFYIPPHLAYGAIGLGNVIPPDAPLIYEIELLEVLNLSEYEAFMQELADKQRKMFRNRLVQQFEMDKKKINEYALLHRLKVNRTVSGLSYILTKEGRGKMPENGSHILFYYEGRLLNDLIFDENYAKKPKIVVLGDENLMQGLDEGLRYFNEGAEGYLFMPSNLVENEQLPNSVLIYRIQIVEVK